ncbi:MAG TPA: helix-turn-helix domain-containing protein [Puia sp.]|nr:helix-turn-helix domain-containing protein [Puia sp.]
MQSKNIVPILFPYEPQQYWEQLRQIVREEVAKTEKQNSAAVTFETAGLTYKPLFKMIEVCKLFQISRPTIYEWIKDGKLKPYKIRARVYFLWDDITGLLNSLKN